MNLQRLVNGVLVDIPVEEAGQIIEDWNSEIESIEQKEAEEAEAKAAAENKLAALGLTADDLKALLNG